MKRKVTQAVIDANRTNAKKSPGPRTAAGKLRAKRNAITHGFFSRELALNDEEERQFEALRRTLHPQLSPETVLQDIAFGEVLSCIGRCKLALRMEMRRVSRALGQGSASQAQSNPPSQPLTGAAWYFSGKQGLREGMRLLEAVKQEFLSLGRIDERWNAPLDGAFGPQFRQLLTQWMPSNESAVLLAHHLTGHAEMYGRPLPPLEKEQDSTKDGGNKPKLILDPDQGKQMVIKLFELEGSILSDLWRSSEQRASVSAGAQNDAVDFAPRYFTTTCRDLHRAVAWFIQLKKDRL